MHARIEFCSSIPLLPAHASCVCMRVYAQAQQVQVPLVRVPCFACSGSGPGLVAYAPIRVLPAVAALTAVRCSGPCVDVTVHQDAKSLMKEGCLSKPWQVGATFHLGWHLTFFMNTADVSTKGVEYPPTCCGCPPLSLPYSRAHFLRAALESYISQIIGKMRSNSHARQEGLWQNFPKGWNQRDTGFEPVIWHKISTW